MKTLNKNLVDMATDFVMDNSTYIDRAFVRDRISRHIYYKTCKILFDDRGKVCATCCWNISPDGQIADVLDMIIRKDYRGKDIMRGILMLAVKMWPLKYLRYNRDYTITGESRWQEPKKFKVSSFLRRRA